MAEQEQLDMQEAQHLAIKQHQQHDAMPNTDQPHIHHDLGANGHPQQEEPAISPHPDLPHIPVTSEESQVSDQPDVPHISPQPELPHIPAPSEVSHVSAEPELSHVSPQPELPHVSPQPELSHIPSTTEVSHISAQSELPHVSPQPDLPHIPSEVSDISATTEMPHISESAEVPHISPVKVSVIQSLMSKETSVIAHKSASFGHEGKKKFLLITLSVRFQNSFELDYKIL